MENEVYTRTDGNREGIIKEINGRFIVCFTMSDANIISPSYASLEDAKQKLDYYFDHYETA